MATYPMSVHPYILQANEGQAVWYTTLRMTLKATSESTGGALSLVEALAAPGSAPPGMSITMMTRCSTSWTARSSSNVATSGLKEAPAPSSSCRVVSLTALRSKVRRPLGSWSWGHQLASISTLWMPERLRWRRVCVHSPSMFSRWPLSRPNMGWRFWDHRLSKRSPGSLSGGKKGGEHGNYP